MINMNVSLTIVSGHLSLISCCKIKIFQFELIEVVGFPFVNIEVNTVEVEQAVRKLVTS